MNAPCQKRRGNEHNQINHANTLLDSPSFSNYRFLLLRFRPRLKFSYNPLTKEELTDFIERIIVILHNELLQVNLTENQYRQYIELINMSADQIFSHNDDLVQEVYAMTRPLIELSDDKIERLTLQLKKKDYQLQKRDSVIKSLTAELAKYKQVFGDFEENQSG